MIEKLFTELMNTGLIFALLAVCVVILYKRDDRRVKANEVEIKELRTRYENELLTARNDLILIAKEHVTVIKEVKAVVGRCTGVMDCLIQEIKEVKPHLTNHK